jgi:hypothetical protein
MLSSSDLLVMITKPKAKENMYTAMMMLLSVLQKITSTEVTLFETTKLSDTAQ